MRPPASLPPLARLLPPIGLLTGLAAGAVGRSGLAGVSWTLATLAGLAPLTVSIVRDLRRGRAGVDVVALLAMAGALILGEVLAGAVIAVMLASGRALEEYAGARARRELGALLERAPSAAWRYSDGELIACPVGEVRPGDRLLVKSGQVIPVDGLLAGPAVLDESALTGEARPVERQAGERVPSGIVNAGGPVDLIAVATASESTYTGIVRLVEQAQASKAPLTRLADRWALLFVPATLLVAGGAWALTGEAGRALAVLVVATPCPLILAVPVAIVAGISRAARRGVIVKGGGALEALGRVRTLLLDKTGTLTAGTPALTRVDAPEADPDELLRLVASLDQVSPHILAAAIVKAARDRGLPLTFPVEVEEVPGEGIRGLVGVHLVAVGKAAWAASGPLPGWARSVRRRAAFEGASAVFAAVDGRLAGVLLLGDPVRADTPRTIRLLRQVGITRIVMITGDQADAAERVAAVLGIDRVFAERTPADKAEVVAAERTGGTVVMVGDGINDAPALASADVGVAMGARGATASSEAADVVLLVDRLDRLVEAVRIARRSRRIAQQSILVGMGLSLVAMGWAAAGFLSPVVGALLQEAIDVAVILNALRALGGDHPGQRSAGNAAAAATGAPPPRRASPVAAED
jgi:heavy metal translocating P-type ATPase